MLRVFLEFILRTYRNAKIKKLVEDLESLESSASEYRKGDLMTIRKTFDKAVGVDGLPDVYPYIYDILLKKKTQNTTTFWRIQRNSWIWIWIFQIIREN
ncbi:hypothetical protein GCK72_009437 [Caenorhabditis remanei]|uniref:Uncharacterized protein n=1 Tax=Caenorhabditis remanei TaxID=31234 RepID=A0A6A5H3U2_CAERE|nr:hypothetical protein GCK72_009437 [Caenorhabditis remanei]KAF1761183.1 hypothetical protein GCK72_009437 [Caenorhabditis remanei]